MRSAWLGESRDEQEETVHGWRGRAGVLKGIERLLHKGCPRDAGCRSPRIPCWASSLPPKHGAPCGYGTHLTAAGEGPCPRALSGRGLCRHWHAEVVPVAGEHPACPGTTGRRGWLRRCSSRCSRAHSQALLPARSWGRNQRERDGSEQHLHPPHLPP